MPNRKKAEITGSLTTKTENQTGDTQNILQLCSQYTTTSGAFFSDSLKNHAESADNNRGLRFNERAAEEISEYTVRTD